MAFNFIKRQLLKVIEWTDETQNTILYRFDVPDRYAIMRGSQLTVRESQVCIFVVEGKIADVFTPGRYKLDTENLPVLTALYSWKYAFETPYTGEVYFVNTKQFTNQKWGTSNPIMMRDKDFGVIRLRGYGIYSYKVEDAVKLMRELSGTNQQFLTENIADQLRKMILSTVTDVIAESGIAALDLARAKGLRLPIVCNTGGYETVESVQAWRGYIDIWLADLKYVSSALSAELSAAPDYFAEAKPAIEAMMAQAGHPVFDADGILQKGVILRHLALPGHVEDSFAVLNQMAAWNDADPGCFLPSVMSQYTPFYKAAEHGIGRRITTYEYRRVVNYAMDKGLVQGYMQQKSSAKEEYTPSFDLTGV